MADEENREHPEDQHAVPSEDAKEIAGSGTSDDGAGGYVRPTALPRIAAALAGAPTADHAT